MAPVVEALPLVERLRRRGVPVTHRPQQSVEHLVGGRLRRFCLPITFTPFASARPCSARCIFCSEAMVPKASERLSATLRPGPGYLAGLEASLRHLEGLPMGISLSGLEATDDPDWLCPVLDRLQAHQEKDSSWITDRVLYTNGQGLSRHTHGARLIPRLVEFGLTRAEMSRHHHDGERNQAIMRLRSGMAVADQAVWEETARSVAQALPVRVVAILQERGLNSVAEVERYLAWATRRVGARDIVLREFSDPHDLYRPNATLRVIQGERVRVEGLVEEILQSHPQFEPCEVTLGYYFWNVRMAWRGRAEVTFEASDYGSMKARHHSEVIYKLVYHANGNLCGDWDPDTTVLLENP